MGLQCTVVAGVLVGTVIASCLNSDQCAAGTYCHIGGSSASQLQSRCFFCGQNAPLPAQVDPATGGTLNDGGAATLSDFAGYNLTGVAEVCAQPSLGTGHASFGTHGELAVVSWCEACVRNDGTVDPLTAVGLLADNEAAMRPFDWAALLFATLVVALAVVGELKVCAAPSASWSMLWVWALFRLAEPAWLV